MAKKSKIRRTPTKQQIKGILLAKTKNQAQRSTGIIKTWIVFWIVARFSLEPQDAFREYKTSRIWAPKAYTKCRWSSVTKEPSSPQLWIAILAASWAKTSSNNKKQLPKESSKAATSIKTPFVIEKWRKFGAKNRTEGRFPTSKAVINISRNQWAHPTFTRMQISAY